MASSSSLKQGMPQLPSQATQSYEQTTMVAATGHTKNRIWAAEFKGRMGDAWKPSKGMQMTVIQENLFLFTFFDPVDLKKGVE